MTERTKENDVVPARCIFFGTREEKNQMNRRWRYEVDSLGPWAVHDGDQAAVVLVHIGNHGKSAIVRFDKSGTNFPFKPVKVTVRNFDFKDLVQSLHSNPVAMRLTREIIKSECIVCDSILCRGNWHAQTRLTEVRNEVCRGLELKLRYADRLLVWMLCQRLPRLPKDVFSEVESFL